MNLENNSVNVEEVDMKDVFNCYTEEEKKEFAVDYDELIDDMKQQAITKKATVFMSDIHLQIANYLQVKPIVLTKLVNKYSKHYKKNEDSYMLKTHLILKGEELCPEKFNYTVRRGLNKLKNNRKVMNNLRNTIDNTVNTYDVDSYWGLKNFKNFK
jgi:hypothetical protein